MNLRERIIKVDDNIVRKRYIIKKTKSRFFWNLLFSVKYFITF